MLAATTSCWRYICSFLRMPRCQTPDEEAALMYEHQAWLLHSTVVLIVLSILGHTASFLDNLLLEQHRHDHPFAWEGMDARFSYFAWSTFVVWFHVLGMSCIFATKLTQPESATKCAEYTLVVISVVLNIGTPLLNRWSGPSLMGADPRSVWIQSVDHVEMASGMKMFTCMVVVSALPLRCSLVLVHHVIVAVSNVVIRVCFGSPAIGVNLMVIIVAAGSFTNAYRIGSFTRQSWTAMRQSQTDAEGRQSELERQQATTGAIRSVFRVLFDVVLHMGDSFTLAGENCSFRGALGEVDNTVVAGARLTDFVTADERDRLRELVENASKLNVPQLMATTIVSAAGESIQHAEILVADTKLDGEHKYLVGLRFPPLPLDNEVDPLPSDFRDQARQVEGRVAQRAPSTGIQRRERGHAEMSAQIVGRRLQHGADVSSATSDSSVSRPWMPLYIRGGQVAATVNSGTPEYRIKSCSASFEDLCELNPVGQAFSSWVVDPDRFRCWVEHQANTLLHSEDGLHDSPSFHLTLRTPSGIARGMELRVRVKVAIEQSSDSSREREDYFPVQLMIERHRWRLIQDRDPGAKYCSL